MAAVERSAGWLASRRAAAMPMTTDLPSPRLVLALARVEARRMLVHPVYLITLVFGVFTMGLRSLDDISFALVGPLLITMVVGLFVGTLITANLAAVRSHRDGTDELFGAAPAPTVARTASQVAGVAVGPAAIALVGSIAALAYRLADPSSEMMRDVDPIMLAQFPLAIVAIGALGIAVGRWIPTVFGGAVLLALHIFTGVIWAVPWVIFERDVVSNVWHLVYLVTVTAFFVGAAFARDRRGALPIVVSIVGLAVAIPAAIQQVPPGGY